MAVSKTDSQVLWSTANSLSISSSSNGTSDALTLQTDGFMMDLHLKADNGGTPASGDTVDFYALFTGGDPDGASTDEYDTVGHALFLGSIDTNDEDPGIITKHLDFCPKGLKIYVVNNSSGRSITVSCGVTEYSA